MGGVRFGARKEMVTGFGEALIGGASVGGEGDSENGFAFAFGVGVDVNVSDAVLSGYSSSTISRLALEQRAVIRAGLD